jgi:hypothetical protein
LYTSCVLDCALRFFNDISLTYQKKHPQQNIIIRVMK